MLSLLISLFLITSCMVLSLYSTLKSPWTTFELDANIFTHNLFTSTTVPSQYDRADYKCLESLSCSDIESDLCSISQKLTLARNIFVPFEVFSLVLQVFILERIILKIFNKPFGSANYFLFLIWALPLFKSIGTVAFLIVSDVSFESSLARGRVKAEEGVFINFGSVIASILASLVMILMRVHQTSRLWRVQIKVSTGKFFNPMMMFVITQVLFILSNVYPTSSFNEFNVVKINIDYVNHIDNYSDGLPIDCVAGQECRVSPYSCKVFNSLATTSVLVSYVRSFNYLFAILWGESFVHLLIKIRLGTNFMNMAYPVLYVTFCVVGFITYVVKANLGYGAQCNIEQFKNSWVLCAEMGTTFYIITIIFGFLTVVTYLLIYAIYSNRAGFGKEQKVFDDQSDSDLKKKNLSQTVLDNSAVKTSPNVKQVENASISTFQSANGKECERCKKVIGNGEQSIQEGKGNFHYRCYLVDGK